MSHPKERSDNVHPISRGQAPGGNGGGSDFGERLAKLEERMNHLPTSEEIHKLHGETMEKMSELHRDTTDKVGNLSTEIAEAKGQFSAAKFILGGIFVVAAGAAIKYIFFPG